MIEPKSRILKAFVSALSGVGAPVYKFPPKNAPNLYVQLGNITTVADGCKDLFGNECTIDVQVISKTSGSYATPATLATTSQNVLNALQATTTSVIPVDDFDMIYIFLDNSFDDTGLFESDRTYRNTMQFRFQINQISQVSPCENWILFDGNWNDNKFWSDTCVWVD